MNDVEQKKIDDGGPAFPAMLKWMIQIPEDGPPQVLPKHITSGMSTRMWLAATMRGVSLQDIRDYLGWPKTMPLQRERWFAVDKDNKGKNNKPPESVDEKFDAMPLREKIRIIAEVCFLSADAMIAASRKDQTT